MRLLALVQKAQGIAPNQRFRLEQWAPLLARDHDIAVTFDAFESPRLTQVLYRAGHTAEKVRLTVEGAVRRWRGRRRALGYDAVVILREASLVGGPWFERWLAARGVPFVYDFDDAIWHWERGANGVMSLARAPWKVGTICGLASAVTVGNAYLAEFARAHNPNVAVVRTSIDVGAYPVLPPPPADAPFTVVWTGSHSTLAHLESVRPALEALGRRLPVRLRVVCDVAPAPFDGLELDFVRWTAAREAEDLAAGHVGIMPLPDTPLTRGKCGCKALQYMAIGRPAVVTPLGINAEIVRDGVNGRWASSPEAWTDVLEQLARDPGERIRLGAAARDTVVAGYTAEASAAAFARVVRGVVGARAGARG
jgi:glycosyltransferase involved in cell wall biosynthesis